MKRVKIRVIAEGPTDQLVIRELVNAYVTTQPKLDFEIDFINEQPTADRTSGGGWGMVYKWCLQTPASEREATYFGAGLFANNMGGSSCDALLIHMDSDICEKIGDKTNISPVPTKNAPPSARGVFIKQVIEEWLWPDQTERKGKHIIAPAVEAIEAWLVAGLSDNDLDPESNHNILKRLAELDHELIKNTKIPHDIKSPKKNDKTYGKILNVAKTNVSRILDRCPHFNSMVNEIILTADAV